MNRDQARFTLSSVRPEKVDRSDPQVDAAMQLLADDPELQTWFENSRRFDQAISDRLAEVSPPPGLRDSILTGMEASQAPRWGRRATIISSLAAVLTMGGFLSWAFTPKSINRLGVKTASVREFEREMEEVVSELAELDVASSDPEDLLRWLREKGGAATPQLSAVADPSGSRFVGCKVLEWRGHEVSLICMRQSGGSTGMPNLHLFTIAAGAIEGLNQDELIAHLPETDHSSRKWSTATWQSGDRVYLVLAAGKHADPRKLLPLG